MIKKTVQLILLLIVNVATFAQEIIISEVCPKNATGYAINNGETPDWIEIQNISDKTVNLANYSITDKDHFETPFQMPDYDLHSGGYVILTSNPNPGASGIVEQYETVINQGDDWKYLVPQSEPASNWRNFDYDDSSWLTGPSGFGYGDDDDATIVPNTSSVFIRKTFTVTNKNNILEAFLHIDYDDSFVAYINGVEVVRDGITDAFPAYNVYSGGHEAQLYKGWSISQFKIENYKNALVEGNNVIAIQVHNASETSSDLTLIPLLTFGYQTPVTGAKPVSALTNLKVEARLEFPFKLDAGSETIYIFKGSDIIDSLKMKNVPVDVTVGRYNGNIKVAYYFGIPTPGAYNLYDIYVPETLGKPIISKSTGEYALSFKVGMFTSESNAIIRYTTDGSEPTESSKQYTDSIFISKNTNIRARVFKQGYLPSAVRTVSYIFYNGTQRLPILSITMNHDDLFDPITGLYVDGPGYDDPDPHFGANYWKDWEKPTHVDFIESNGEVAFSYDLGIKIAGNYSRMNSQKSLKFYARSQYGYDAINYQIFPDKPIYSFQSFQIRNAGNDNLNTQMRDGVASTLATSFDGTSRCAYRACNVYINGEYWGVYNLREKVNKNYVASNYNVPIDSLTVLNNNGYGDEGVVWGDESDYHNLEYFIENNSLANQTNYDYVGGQLDILGYINYYILEIYAVNEDWPGNNRKYWKDNREGGKWKYIFWDLDFGFGIWDDSKASRNMLDTCYLNDPLNYWPTPPWSTLFLRKLSENNDFQTLFLNATADRLNTTLSTDSVKYYIDSLAWYVEQDMPYQFDRWESWIGMWYDNVDAMKDFADQREAYMRSHFETHFNTGGSYMLSLAASDENAGKIHVNTIDILTSRLPWSGKYFNNNTITLTALPAPGYTFTGWSGDVVSSEQTITITTDQATSIVANFSYNASSVPQVFFTEVHYNPLDSLSGGNWVEVYNANTVSQDISSWILRDEKGYNAFAIPNGTVIPAKSYFVFCKDTARFNKKHSLSASAYVGNLDFGFSNSQGTISLLSENNFVVDKITYKDICPWPQKADGYGYSMELINITADRTNPLNWRSIEKFGSPGRESLPIVQDPNRFSIVINEINYNSYDGFDAGDWIELHNIASVSVNISGWILKDKGDNSAFMIPEGTVVEAGGFLVLAQSPVKFSSIYPTVPFINSDIGLSSYSDMVRLYDEYEYMVDSVSFSMFAPWPAQANGTGRTLSLTNPISDNALATNWEAGDYTGTPGKPNEVLSVNEIAFHVNVYPNPVSKTLHIDTQNEVLVSMYNMLGVEVYRGSDTEINVDYFSSGVYTVCIVSNKQVVVKQVLIK